MGFRGSADAAERASTASAARDTQAAQAAAQVDAAYRSGGAEAAAKKLKEVTAGVPPEVAADINAAARPTVDKILADLDRTKGRGVDGDQLTGNDAARAFDRTVADLSAALSAGASTARGKAELDHAIGAITDSITRSGVGRFDEALGNTVLGGDTRDLSRAGQADTALAVGVMESLTAAGKTREADDILQNVNDGMKLLNGAVGELSRKVEQHNADLSRLMQDWAPLMTPEQLERAIQNFKDSHPEYAQLEAMGAGVVRAANQLNGVPERLPGLGRADDLSRTLDASTDHLAALGTLTKSGAEELAKLQADPSQPGILDRLIDLAKAGKKDLGYLQKVSTFLVNNAVSQALAASASGNTDDVARAIANLERFGPVFGLDRNSMRSLTESFERVASASTQQEAQDALQRLDRSLENVKGQGAFAGSTGIGTAVRGAALVLSVGVTVGSVRTAIDNPSFQNVVAAYSNAVGTGQAGVKFAQSFFENSKGLASAGNALKVAGNIAGALTAGINVFQAGKALADGDPASAALYAAQAAAGIAALAGATGVGFVVGVGAALALAQLQKVRASNRFEDRHTEAFLQGAGLSPEATHHLRNADDEGRSVGPVFAEMARRMGVDPVAFLQAVGRLPPREILRLVEAAHGVDPDRDGKFRQTHETDAAAGLSSLTPPRSIEGLIVFMRNVGIDLGSLSPPRAPSGAGTRA